MPKARRCRRDRVRACVNAGKRRRVAAAFCNNRWLSWLGGVGHVDESAVELCYSSEDDIAVVCDQVALGVEPSHLFWAVGKVDVTGGQVGCGGLHLGVSAEQEEKGKGEGEKGKEFGDGHDWRDRGWRRKINDLV